MKYRKKPIVVDANQVRLNLIPTMEGQWISNNPFGAVVMRRQQWWKSPVPMIKTLEGWLTVSVGDWIVCGIHGECYPVKPDIFDKTYEAVE